MEPIDGPEFRHIGARYEGAPKVLAWSEMLPGVRFSLARAWGDFDAKGDAHDSSVEVLATGTVTGTPVPYTPPKGVEPNQGSFVDGTPVVNVRWDDGEEDLVAANALFGFDYQSETIGHEPVFGDHFCVVADN